VNVRRLMIQIAIALVLFEVSLHVYNPMPSRVRGDRIVLPVHQSYTFNNAGTHKLDPVTHHTKNSLGFRGPDPPADWRNRLTILAIGGSTTECTYLSDGRTWTDQLARRLSVSRPDAWVNNAGLDGQSTFGHIVLLRQFVMGLKPSLALFLVGANDVERGDANGYDRALTPASGGTAHRALAFVAEHSEIAGLTMNAVRAWRARRAGFGHSEVNLPIERHLVLDPRVTDRLLKEHREKYLNGYRDRVTQVLALAREANITPVLITQPALFGDTVDLTTHVDLREVQVNGRGNGLLEWKLLEIYNDVTRQVGAANGVTVIDLARLLPKDSRYFYDFLHFTNEGAVHVGDIVYAGLTPVLDHSFVHPVSQ
jgi:lysophospholipase L1-like esterase